MENKHIYNLEKLKGESKDLDETLDYSIGLLRLLDKWGIGSYSLEEIDRWRDRLVWHVHLAGEINIKDKESIHIDNEEFRRDLSFIKNYYASIGEREKSDHYQLLLDNNPLISD